MVIFPLKVALCGHHSQHPLEIGAQEPLNKAALADKLQAMAPGNEMTIWLVVTGT